MDNEQSRIMAQHELSVAAKDAIEVANAQVKSAGLPTYSALYDAMHRIAGGAPGACSIALDALKVPGSGEAKADKPKEPKAGMKLFRGNWDGTNERAVVCATKKRAMELLGTSAKAMTDYFSAPSTTVREDTQVVWENPETVFQRKMTYGPTRDAWERVESN